MQFKSGKRFGRLVIVRELRRYRQAGEPQFFRRVLAKCDCGRRVKVLLVNLKRGGTKSCGCLRVEIGKANGAASRRHGHSRFGTTKRCSAEYNAYSHAKTRCRCKTHSDYPDYGGRGIEFRFERFEDWFAELGVRPSPVHSVDRIEVDSHYEVGNVRWATSEMQANNRRKRRSKKP